MYIANFTPDTIEWMHGGKTGQLEEGDILEFEDASGKHILNKWGARGLLRVGYEDKGNEAELREKGMKIYNRFWQRHISVFNQHNESLKNENKPYVHPDPKTEEKAAELGVELVGPWKMITPAAGVDVKKLETMEGEMAELKKMVSDLANVTKEATQQRDNALIEQFSGLDDLDFRAWMDMSLAKIRKWPEGIRALVRVKWDTTQSGEVYPLEA